MTTPHRRERPVVAVIGSVDPDREFNPPLRNAHLAPSACRELGRELALAGFDLAVFSSKPQYVESYVVEGYADGTDEAQPSTVYVHLPRHREADFRLPPGGGMRIEVVRDSSSEWEVSFYRTIVGCDGAVLIGGGQSTRVAGVVAMSQRVPLLPVAAFGGGAGLVWVNLDKVRNDALDEDMAVLGGDWAPDSGQRLAACLQAQRHRRETFRVAAEQKARRSARRSATGLAVAALLTVLSLLGIIVSGEPRPADARGLALLLGAPLLAAMSGAIIRNSFEPTPSWPTSCVRGLGAGMVAVLTYVAAQLLAVPAMLDELDVRRLLFFVITIGFTAGFTFDLVFERLRAAPDPSDSRASGPAQDTN
ncbi:hypothetical protein [Streptomyces sp. NPDC051677]|uniref:hypothetical protein n=1 Tax=Streptomyces sp. NPDC051677 TaxID=3365669 RepID=UPI0037D7CD5F